MTRAHELVAVRWNPALSAATGEAVSPAFRILIDQRVLREVQKRILTGRAEESVGLLLGEAAGEPEDASAYVFVDRFLPSVDPVPEDVDAETLGRILRPLLEAASLAGKTVGGWYRGHARLGPSLSEEEVRLHRRWFEEPWQFALIGLSDAARPGGAVFARTRRDHLAPVPFHELLGRDATLPDGRKATSLTWRNYRTMEAVVRPGEPVEAPPEPRMPPVEMPPEPRPPPVEMPPASEAASVEMPPASETPPVEPRPPPVEPPPESEPPPVEPPSESEAPPVEPRMPSFEMVPEPPGPAEPDRPAASAGSARRPERPTPPVTRRRGVPPSARGQPLIVLPDAARSRPRRRARPLAALAVLVLLSAAGWWAWNRLAPEGGAGEGAASPEPPDTIEFAVPVPEGGAVPEGEGSPEPDRSVEAPGGAAGAPAGEPEPEAGGAAEVPAGEPEPEAGEAAEAPAAEPEPEAGPPPAAVPLSVLADRVFEAVEAYGETRHVYDRGRADCRELWAAHARAARAFRELSERFAALRGRVGPAAGAEYRQAAAAMDEVERHLVATGCPE